MKNKLKVKDLETIWEKFLDDELEEFEFYHGYGLIEIFLVGMKSRDIIKSMPEEFKKPYPAYDEEQRKMIVEVILSLKKGDKTFAIRKFIDAMGWREPEHVSLWRTNTLKVCPCIECGKEYGTFPDEVGICGKCRPLFDQNKINVAFKYGAQALFNEEDLPASVPTVDSEEYTGLVALMRLNKEVREACKKQ